MTTDPITQSFAGAWLTTFGEMTLEQHGTKITGVYHYGNTEGRIDGSMSGDALQFRYNEPNEHGEGQFRLLRAGGVGGPVGHRSVLRQTRFR